MPSVAMPKPTRAPDPVQVASAPEAAGLGNSHAGKGRGSGRREAKRDFYVFTSHGAYFCKGSSIPKALKEVKVEALINGQIEEKDLASLQIFGAIDRSCVVEPSDEHGPFLALVMRNHGRVRL